VARVHALERREGWGGFRGDGSAPCTQQELGFHKRLAEDALRANEHMDKNIKLAEEDLACAEQV
jgi:hypothetical protein